MVFSIVNKEIITKLTYKKFKFTKIPPGPIGPLRRFRFYIIYDYKYFDCVYYEHE